MSKKYQSLPGMDDLLPAEIEKWQWLEEKTRIFFESRGFKEIRTPVMEPTELFARSIGEASDIVHKEMFTFQDRGGRNVTLRPELTASVARSVIEKGLLKTSKCLYLYYVGPMFRAERPQAGRKRQFHQIGVEMINLAGPGIDGEIIAILYRFLHFVGVEKIKLSINDLGDTKERPKLLKGLVDYFTKNKERLCEDCRFRLEKNVLRIFDCKAAACQPVIREAPWDEVAPLSETFQKLSADLKAQKIPYQINRRLVRGLDYYNGTVFELTAEGLGAQDAIAGGGRYDHLYEELGGTPAPCTGFSIGMERLLAALEAQRPDWVSQIRKNKIYFAPFDLDPAALNLCYQKAEELWRRGFKTETVRGENSLSQHLKKANQLGVRFVFILGPDEFKKGKATVKDLEKREQTEISFDKITEYFERVIPL